ncbi:MAG TPA: efflux RND transporter periplasmic adaptor subunit, partial [Candidatus Omnitrophota bacterium]|nr:efflux RND transporter periplasmic adaptor subunit [Candidatus Omnitrophota bacterium]
EAVVHDVAVAGRIAGATASSKLIPDHAIPLVQLGVSPRIDAIDQGIHALFQVAPEHARALKVGLPVDVFLATGATTLRTAVPRDAVVQSGGRQVVFVRKAPEVFEARPVVVHQVVGPLAEVFGVQPGDRVVVQGVEQLKAAR